MRWVRRGAGLISALGLAASLLLARVHPFGDAGLFGASAPQAPLLGQTNIPPAARDLLAAKCADCHSEQTRTPFYGRFAPISWLLERDIVEGRQRLNLSQWDRYTPDQQQTLLAKIVQETKANDMPLPQYRMIHRDTRITPADLAVLAAWAHDPPADAGAPHIASERWDSTTLPGDPTRGAAVFAKRCTGCHSLTENREGPRLASVYGRAAASIAGFSYSPALTQSHVTWNETTLGQWLTDPDTFVPGVNMDFRVVKPQERADLIAYFKQAAQ